MKTAEKQLFLAGATGMLGAGLLNLLEKSQLPIRVRATWCSTQPYLEYPNVEYVQADLRDLDQCRRAVRGCDCAIMAAASSGGAAALTQQASNPVQDNLLMNAQMLEAFQLEGVKRVIVVGSASVYQPSVKPVREADLDFNQDPGNGHLGVGWVFRFLEKMCQFRHKTAGMEFVIIRAGNIFGPYDKFDPANSHFIPALLRKASEKVNPFEIWGSPDVVRDVIFAGDLADAVIRLLDAEDIHFDVFNVSSGIPTSIGQVVHWALELADYSPIEIRYDNSKPTTIPYRVLDCSKINDRIGWQPITGVYEAMGETLRWWNKNKEWWKR